MSYPDHWIRSDTETRSLQEAPHAPINCGVYRRRDLIAMTYCDPAGLWHLMLAVERGQRPPQVEELIDACATLLRHIEHFELEAGLARGRVKWLPATPLVHVKEIRREPHPRTTQ